MLGCFSSLKQTLSYSHKTFARFFCVSSQASFSGVDLHFNKTASPEPTLKPPLFILHGLFGHSGNWRSLAQRIAQTKRDVYAIDIRNHGSSPHADDMDYSTLARDVAKLQQKLNIPEFDLIGHSMGGKVAMMIALTHPDSVRRAMIMDIAPVSYSTKDLAETWSTVNFVIGVMSKFPLDKIQSRKDADEKMESIVPGYVLRQFILQNLVSEETENGGKLWKWRVNLDAIRKNSHEIADFNVPLNYSVYEKPTVFIRGTKSDFILESHKPVISKYFPSSSIIDVHGAGHWIHMEQPDVFLNITSRFLDD